MNEGDRFECEIESVAFGGDGVARVENIVAFIPFSLPGERVIARINRIKRDYIKASIVEILKPSPERVEPQCPLYKHCAGCSYLHASYPAELEMKLAQLRRLLHGSGQEGIEELVRCASSPDMAAEEMRRNKIVLHTFKDGTDSFLGYIGRNGQIIDIPQCPAANDKINQALAAEREKPGFFHSIHRNMNVTFRYTEHDGALMWRNKPARNMSWLKEEMPFGKFSVPAGSFSQVNRTGAATLLGLLKKELERRPAPIVVDAYSGAGLFALACAINGTEYTVAIESDAEAVKACEFNFKQHNVESALTALTGDTSELLPVALAEIPAEGLCIVDPPRSGIPAKLVYDIADTPVRRLVYISCNPATLGRDLASLIRRGFTVRSLDMVNMFPRSGHFEIFTVLERSLP